MTSTPPAFAGFTVSEINQIMKLFNNEEPKWVQAALIRADTRLQNFLMALLSLSVISGVTFPNMSIKMFEYGDTATTIQIGSWYRDLHGLYFHGDVASLESDTDDDTVHFKSFEDLVKYVTSIADEQASTAANSS